MPKIQKLFAKGISMRETVIINGNFLLTHDFAIGIPYWESRGLILNNITLSTVSTVSFSNSSPFLSGLINLKILIYSFIY